jgi:hypothetical protein
LDAEQWTVRAGEYASRVERFVTPHVRRAQIAEPHPIWDFLFSYHSLRPRQLRCWHPGYGVVLTGSEAIRRYRNRRGYTSEVSGVTVSDDYLKPCHATRARPAAPRDRIGSSPAREHGSVQMVVQVEPADRLRVDMRASPYDLQAYGYQPVRIETACGRAEYVREQAAIAERAAVVRQDLLARCRALLDAAAQGQP